MGKKMFPNGIDIDILNIRFRYTPWKLAEAIRLGNLHTWLMKGDK